MIYFYFEITKILKRHHTFIFLVATFLLFPTGIAILTKISIEAGEISEGLFLDTVSLYTLKFSQTYLFIPVWVLIFNSQEFKNGHVQKVIFLKSREFYFLSKIVYCLIISFLFSFFGLFSLFLCCAVSGFKDLNVSFLYIVEFFSLFFLSSLALSIFLSLISFTVRSPGISFIVYIGWQFIESIIFLLFYKLYDIKLSWLPLHSIQILFNKEIEKGEGNYRRLFTEFEPLLLVTFLMSVLILIVIYKHFQRTDLKPLSD